MKEARLEAKVTDLCLEQVQISDTLPPSPQKGLDSDLKKPTAATGTWQSLPWPCSPWSSDWDGQHQLWGWPQEHARSLHLREDQGLANSFYYTEQHSPSRKKFYFSELCLWDTGTFKIIFTSYTKPAGKVAGAQTYFVIFFLVKTGGRNGKSATQRKQIWNYLFWLVLYVLLGNTRRGD